MKNNGLFFISLNTFTSGVSNTKNKPSTEEIKNRGYRNMFVKKFIKLKISKVKSTESF